MEARAMTWCFELKAAANGQFMWNLKTDDNEIVLTSELYKQHDGALNGIASTKRNASDEKRFELMMAKDGTFYFVLKAANGQTIGKSAPYKTRAGCESGIKTMRTNAPLAAFKDLTKESQDACDEAISAEARGGPGDTLAGRDARK
jgi:uncharacterized protein YegP (UPF0339 family)